MATTTNGLPVPNTGDAPNGPAQMLEFGNAVDATYGASVANFAALPASGDFVGHQIWLVDKKTHAAWNGTAWKIPIQSAAGVGTGTLVANTVKTVAVVFPVAYPAGVVPVVQVSASSTFPHNRFASPGSTTNTGFDVSVINTVSTTQFTFNWIAQG